MKKIIIPVLLVFLIQSCNLVPSSKPKPDNKTTKMESILNSFSTSLKDTLTPTQNELLLKKSKEATANVTSEDPEEVIPLAVETIIGSLNKTTFEPSIKLKVVEKISSQSVTIIKNDLENTNSRSRAIDLTKLKNILNRVAKSIVRSVPSSGISEEEFSKASAASVKCLVSSLGNANVSENEFKGLSESITEGAIFQINESKDKYKDVDNALTSISQGAVEAVVDLKTIAVKKDELIQGVTKVALKAAAKIESEDKTKLILAITDGTTKAINQKKDTLKSEGVVKAIKSISKETIKSIGNLDLSDEDKKKKVTELSSKIGEKVMQNLSGVEDTVEAVVSGIASGAQGISNEFSNPDVLKEAIKITDSEGKEIDLTELTDVIEDGISNGQKENIEEANQEEKDILEALKLYTSSIKDIQISIESTLTPIQEDIDKLKEVTKSLVDVTEKYPNNQEYLGEVYFRISESNRLLYQLNKNNDTINAAIDATKKAYKNYDTKGWYAFESLIILRKIYSYDTKEYDKSLDIANYIITHFKDNPASVMRGKHTKLDTYKEILYHEYKWKNPFGDSTDFINNTYLPAIDDIINSSYDFSGQDHWIYRVATERKAETFIWLHDLEGSINYCHKLIEELENSDLPDKHAKTTQANLYYIAAKFLREETGDWPPNKLELINGAIESAEEGLKLAKIDGKVVDRWVYANTLDILLSSIAQKACWPWDLGPLGDSVLFNMDRRFNELLLLARNFGNDKAGQRVHSQSYIHEGRFYMSMGHNYNYGIKHRARAYFNRAKTTLETLYEGREDFYLIEGNELYESIGIDLVPVYLNLHGYEKAINFYNELVREKVKSDWAVGAMQGYIARHVIEQIKKLNLSEEKLNYWYDEISKMQPIAKEIFDREPSAWYSKEIQWGFSSFYFFYFIKMREILPKPEAYENERLISARHNSIHYKKPENGINIPGYGYTDQWYPLLFDDEANKYGDEVLLEGGVNVIIK